MKKTSNSLFTQISNEEMQNLLMEVKETIAEGNHQNNVSKSFTAADLWSIQRQFNTRTSRRFF